MKIIRGKLAMMRWSLLQKAKGKRIAFVPTMGSLHEGHLSLVQKARKSADRVVVSIYVNPTQFGSGEDFDRYPRTLKRDAALLQAQGVDLLFAPVNMYESDTVMKIDPGPMQHLWCGATRPDHFSGVATIVLKLFNTVQPDVAIFGQKDAQQATILKRMVRELDVPVQMVVCPIVRDADGLALSSRNAYLTAEERAIAPTLYHALKSIQKAFRAGQTNASAVIEVASKMVKGSLEYLVAVDGDSLQPVKRLEKKVLLLGAMQLGRTRLIDNIRL